MAALRDNPKLNVFSGLVEDGKFLRAEAFAIVRRIPLEEQIESAREAEGALRKRAERYDQKARLESAEELRPSMREIWLELGKLKRKVNDFVGMLEKRQVRRSGALKGSADENGSGAKII